MPTINLVDETPGRGRFEPPPLALKDGDLTVRDLISLRVRAEVRRYNLEGKDRYYGLVAPSDLEQMLNCPAERPFQPIDADRQVEIALQAFQSQRFVVLLPCGQADDLDSVIHLEEGEEVSFLRLVPLVGG